MDRKFEITLLRNLSAGLSSHSETLIHTINASGTRSIATSRQGEMIFYDIDKARFSQPYDGDCGDIWGVSLSASNLTALTVAAPARHVHSGDDYWFLSLWNTAEDKLLSRFKIQPGCYFSAASADLRVAMGAHRGHISWWDPKAQQCVGSVANPHSQDVFRLAVSGDGALGASTCTKEVYLWDISARKPIKSIALPKPGLLSKRKMVGSIRFGAGHLYMGSNDGKVWVTDLAGTKLDLIVDSGHELWVEALDIHEKSSLAALLIWGGRLELWDLYSGKLVGAVETGHEGRVSDVRIKPDASSVLTAGKDGTLRVWSLGEGEKAANAAKPGGQADQQDKATRAGDPGVKSAARTKNATSGPKGHAAKPPTFVEFRALTGHSGAVNACAINTTGERIVSASDDEDLIVWDVATGRELRTLTGHTYKVEGCAWSPDGTRIVSASGDLELKVWDAGTGRELRTLSGHTDDVKGCAFSPDGAWIVSASRDETLKVWDAVTGQELRTLSGHTSGVASCAVSPDGRWIVSASWDKTLKVWDSATGKQLRTLTGHIDDVSGCAVSPNGQFIVSASWDKTLKVWDSATGKELRTLTGHTEEISGCAWSPDGTWIVSASWDKTLKVWDSATGKELRTLTGHSGPITGCAWSPEGDWIVSSGTDEQLKMWRSPGTGGG